MTDDHTLNQKLMDLILVALDHGIESVQSKKGTLTCFMITETNGEKNLIRFATERQEEGPVQAKQMLLSYETSPDFAVIAYDSHVTIDSTKYDAVMVEGFDKSEDIAHIFAQRYKPKRIFFKFKTIGNAVFLGISEKAITSVNRKFKCLVMFNNINLQLDIAEQKLKDSGLVVNRTGDILATQFDTEGPVLYVSHHHGEQISETCKSLGKDTEYEKELNRCNAYYQIAFNDLEKVLDEINTLIDVQGTLENLTQGVVYNNWNHELSKQ